MSPFTTSLRFEKFTNRNGYEIDALYLGEIGLVGKAPGKYNLYLGAGLDGMRLNKLYRQAITHEEIVAELKPVLQDFAGNRSEGERFGDFCIRSGYVKATGQGADFHD